MFKYSLKHLNFNTYGVEKKLLNIIVQLKSSNIVQLLDINKVDINSLSFINYLIILLVINFIQSFSFFKVKC